MVFRALVLACLCSLFLSPSPVVAQEGKGPNRRPYGSFTFTDQVEVTLSPQEAFDRFVEVDAWWDHRFSDDPVSFFLDPRPGGGFYEIMDESGDGVRHAEVIFVVRGKTLRLRGPLGMSGFALDMVFNLDFQAMAGGTRLHLDARGAGELEEGWAEAVQGVWHHFLVERFKPYAEGRLPAGSGSPPTGG